MGEKNDLLFDLLEGDMAESDIILLDYSYYKAGYKFKYHSYINSVEIVLVTYGSCYITVNGYHAMLRKGECIVIFPEAVHNFYLKEHESCKLINFIFNPFPRGKDSIFKPVAQQLFLFSELEKTERSFIKFVDDGTIEALLEKMISLRKRKCRFQRLLIMVCFCELYMELSMALEESVKNSAASKNVHINKALDYITGNISEKITLELISDYAGISSRQLTNLFIKEFGMTLPDYVNIFKIGKARELLENTLIPVTDIAHRLGFSSSQYFTTCFKKLIHFTPREYREKYAKNM